MAAKKGKSLKHTIKYLSGCKNSQLISQIIGKSPDNVTKSICNAALNAAQGSVRLNRNQKRVLSRNRQFVNKLIQRGDPISKKRKILVQSGGNLLALVIPTILSAVLSSIGSRLFK
ncbi:MAG: hypothetical protein FD143_3670 [Ignavibacteria bacterium]|nr:MAG: hypothetical protein FD143_3670 [Ignavibacteria bacterium]